MTRSVGPRAGGTLAELLRFTRAHEWHPGKVPAVVGAACLAAVLEPPAGGPLPAIVATYVLTVLFLAFGYMLNNTADHDSDLRAGKAIGPAGWTRARKAGLTAAVGLAGLSGAELIVPPAALPGVLTCYLLAWLYSMPPRWKEHVVAGPIVGAFAQAPAPALVVALAWGGLRAPMALYIGALWLYGLRMMLVHQLLDRDNDRRSGTRTTAVVAGVERTRGLVRATLAVEVVALGVCLAGFALAVGPGWSALPLLLLGWSASVAFLRLRRGERMALYDYSWIPAAALYESALPLTLAGTLAVLQGPEGGVVLLMVVLLFAGRHVERLIAPLLPMKEANA